ncbi:MAG: hypothetical protein AAGL90_06560 [Pseudomonadota bacterium]
MSNTLIAADHEIRLFYLGRTRQSDLSAPDWCFDDYRQSDIVADEAGKPARIGSSQGRWLHPHAAKVKSDEGAAPIWIEDPKPIASPDLFPAARSLMNGRDSSRARRYVLNAQSKPTNRMVDLFLGNGAKRDDPRLALILSRTAQDRLHTDHGFDTPSIEVRIGAPDLHVFRSGVSLLDLPISLKLPGRPLHPDLILEALHAFARFNTLTWTVNGSVPATPSAAFRLGDIARAVLDGPASKVRSDARVFSAVYMRVSGAESRDVLDDLAVRAAKHYSARYDVGALDEVEIQLRRPFQGKARAAAPEGGAIVIADEPSNPFVRNYKQGPWRQAYAPLALLALHEQEAWSRLVSSMTKWHDFGDKNAEATLATISQARTQALQLRTAYSLPRVSYVADHDLWSNDLRQSMRIPDLKTAISQDLANTEALIRDDAERRRSEKFKWLSVVAGSSIAGFTALSVVTELFQASPIEAWTWGWDPDVFVHPEFVLPVSAFGVAAISAALWLWLKLRTRKNKRR